MNIYRVSFLSGGYIDVEAKSFVAAEKAVEGYAPQLTISASSKIGKVVYTAGFKTSDGARGEVVGGDKERLARLIRRKAKDACPYEGWAEWWVNHDEYGTHIADMDGRLSRRPDGGFRYRRVL